MSSVPLRVIGVVHLLPLPGSPLAPLDAPANKCLERVLRRALEDANALRSGGVDTAIIENFGDAPFQRGAVEPHVVSTMTYIAHQIVKETGLRLGINVLRNDARAALAIAAAVGAEFIRVNIHTGAAWTDQGLIQGDAYQTLLYRKRLAANVHIAADVLVKHASPAGDWTLLDAAKDTWRRGKAAALILTGSATGSGVDWESIRSLRKALPEAPLWIGSGMTPSQIPIAKELVNGVIVGTHFHRDGDITQPLCAERIRDFVEALGATQPL